MKRLALVLSLALGAGVLLAAPPAQAAPAPLGPLLYAEGRAFYRTALDLTRVQKIVEEPVGTTIGSFAASADGTKFVYVRNENEVVVRNADGSNERVVRRTGAYPNGIKVTAFLQVAITHDASHVAFQFSNDQAVRCWDEIGLQGAPPPFVNPKACGWEHVTYDPSQTDGSLGAYSLDPQGTLRDGGLTGGYPDAKVTGIDQDLRSFAISPDGSRVAWTTRTVHGPAPIWIGNLSGSQVSLAAELVAEPSAESYYNDLAFSPDGSRVYFQQTVRDYRTNDDVDLDYVPAAGGAPVPVTDTPGVDEQMVQPMVAFVAGPVPSAPTAEPATLGGTQAIVRWTSSASDVDSTQITRTSPGLPTVVQDQPGYAVSWENSGLVVGHDYTYEFRTRDRFGQLSAPATRTLTAIEPFLHAADPTSSASPHEPFTVELPALGTHTVTYYTGIYGQEGPWMQPNMTDTKRTFAGIRGRSYHFFITVYDSHGNSSDKTHALTAVVPYDQDAARFGGSTAPQALAGQYRGSARVLRSAGAYAQLSVTGDRFQLVGDRCASCGVFDIYLNGKRVVGVDTRSRVHQVRQVLVSFRMDYLHSSQIVIKARGTAGRPNVVIDGFAVRQ